MSDDLRGQHVVVTGGGSGLGAAIGAAFAAAGADVTLMGRTRETIDAQAKHLASTASGRVRSIVCDVSNGAAVVRAFETATKELGPVRVLVNNAGHAEAVPIQELARKTWDLTIAVNLTGTFLCIQQVLPGMLAAGDGRIVNIASTAGLRGYPQVAAYCAAKHGVVGLTRALATETHRSGVTVNAICPGYIEGTPMLASAIGNVMRATGRSLDEAKAALAKGSPGGRLATIQEVTDAIVGLCLPDAAATTGQAIVIGGDDPS